MRVGVLSDTHGYIDPKIFDLLKGVERILHAGDITTNDVIDELSAIAPVIAVHGNMDYPEIVSRHEEDLRISLAGADIFMTHNGGMLLRSPSIFEKRVGPKRPDVFIWGHTHRPENKMIGDMLSLNPGAACKPRGEHPATVAILTLEPGKKPQAEILSLE
jgi:hypothetical protein